MGLFDNFTAFLTGPVGNALANDPHDVRAAKKHLSRAGYFNEDTENGYITHALDDGIRRYQRDNNLQTDGRMKPGGETERSLFEKLTGRRADRIFGPAAESAESGSVGFGGNTSGTLAPVPPVPQRKPAYTPNNARVQEVDADESEEHTQKKGSDDNILARFAIKQFKDKGYNKSERLFRHYTEGSGKPIQLTSEEINQAPLFIKAIQDNRKRFEDSLVKGFVDNDYKSPNKKSEFKKQILELKDGESIVLNNKRIVGGGDLWDKDLNKKAAEQAKDLDQFYATGNTKLQSRGSLRATRKGNIIEIDGIVDNSIKDLYDFNKEDPQFLIFRNLAAHGKAKPFLVFGSDLEKLTGKLEVKNGAVHNANFKWQKIRP